VIEIDLLPLGLTDEVQPDLGPDERARGLLDRWSSTGSNDELTDDRTEAISASDLAAQGRQAMLDRLGELYQRKTLEGRFDAHEGTPCAPLQALIADEPLDPLPVPDGVPRKQSPILEQENTVEVTQEAPGFAPGGAEGAEETTGWTGAETTLPRPTRGRRWAWIIGLAMLLAAAALAAALIIGDVA
jgi:hypothetical protein